MRIWSFSGTFLGTIENTLIKHLFLVDMHPFSSDAARGTGDPADQGTLTVPTIEPTVKWLTTLSIHQSGKLSDSWSDLALIISTMNHDPWEHLSRYRYKGDVIAIDLHTTCSNCGSWHSFRFTQLLFFRVSRMARFERNLCEDCFDQLTPYPSRRGNLGTDLTVTLDFRLDSRLRRGTIDVVGTKALALEGADRQNMNVAYALDWPDSAAAPVLELIFVCPACFSEQVAASSESSAFPPAEWTCAVCCAGHQRDWAWQMTTVFIKECRCYFCDRSILDHEVATQVDGQLDTRGFALCQECRRMGKWAKEWGLLTVALSSRRISFPSWLVILLADLIVGECQAKKSPHRPSATRLRHWRMIPKGYLPLTLDEDADREDLGY